MRRPMAGTGTWATAQESRADTTGLCRRVRAHRHATVAALALGELGAVGRVPRWPRQRRAVRCTGPCRT